MKRARTNCVVFADILFLFLNVHSWERVSRPYVLPPKMGTTPTIPLGVSHISEFTKQGFSRISVVRPHGKIGRKNSLSDQIPDEYLACKNAF